ncbi:MAG: hypothetical protein FJ041_08180 [Candidatus Cloacimonetes bacterium]|nr:hypothetical protein [Candidatus Cloacimonadota bacterium]
MSIAVADDFNDPLNILSTQYDLTQTSPSYTFAISSGKRSSSDFYSEHQPLIYMKRFSRRNEVLFTLAQAVNYRLYAYGLATEPDGWNYAVNGSYNLFYLVHNGQFATFTDNNPHNSITYSVSDSLNDVNLSLYQAQFMLPSYFLSQVTPVGTLVTLQNLTDLSSLNSAVSATRLDIRDAQNIALTTNFLTGYLTTSYPLLYVPFPYQYSGQHIRFFFKDISGVVTEYTNVTEFSNYALTEFRIYGNSAICFVNNPGTYYVTVSNRKKSLF